MSQILFPTRHSMISVPVEVEIGHDLLAVDDESRGAANLSAQ